ncbi:3-deoxy-D-manno-octulosonic acid transferase [Marinihelvus fidelis]|uniref:3-deoxy-D-manno-octulosonic acid transferase n=1 Tax=Marinihelvus fidelis TaxID=2613842 RepID=A0A5N0TAQ8_9GAMM|nr:lipid IV(A) 3-deoxy-D-manno-octulosonic acid transferase [Marinihelvus fidelis]KAA9131514.1 3-deoxy-D-manno-octulosonic acid transferase [Marinihelvus fidelis]
MRFLYSLAMILATPVLLAYFGVRGFRDHRYWQRWNERLGAITVDVPGGGIIVHAASLGEVNAASPLVSALLQRYPDIPLTITTITPTGSARVRELFGDKVAHQYLPIDLPALGGRLLARLQPRLFLVLETEIWPNLYRVADSRTVPLALVNARMTASSQRGYRRLRGLIAPALRSADAVLAQSEADAERFVDCGAIAERVTVTGNLKFDIEVSASLAETGDMLKSAWGVGRPVLVAGSTHESDEAELVEAFQRLLKSRADALLVVAPRHPERFGRVAEALREYGLRVCLRSDGRVPPADCQCLVVDTMGELGNYYAAADITFVGGTIEPVGGHNLLEPAALGKPLLIGPHTDNVKEIASQLLAAGAAERVAGRNDIADAAIRLFADAAARDRMGQAALRLVENGRGALTKTMNAIDGWVTRDA